MPSASPTDSSSPVSIRRLASVIGTSRSTVSRAFHGDASVRPELRARILAEADRLGYQPDPLVRELMTSFARRKPVNYRETLGVLWWPNRWRQTEFVDSFAGRLRRGLEEAAVKHGCRLTAFVLGKGGGTALGRTLAARRIQGVVLTPPTDASACVPRLDWSRLSVMVVGRSLPEPGFNRVHQHHYGALVEVLRRLRERGFRKPVLLVNVDLEERMQRAYTAAFLAHEAGPPEHVLHMESSDIETLGRRLRGLSPDVIIADVEEWLDRLRKVPGATEGRGFVALDVTRRDGPVTGIHQNAARMAECAIDLLMQARLRHETGVPTEPMAVLTPGSWVEGRTLSKASADL